MLPPNLGRCSIPTCQNIIRKLSPTFFFIEEMHMTTAHAKSGRIDVRASAAAKQLLQEAARAAHKSVGVRECIEAQGAELVFLPP